MPREPTQRPGNQTSTPAPRNPQSLQHGLSADDGNAPPALGERGSGAEPLYEPDRHESAKSNLVASAEFGSQGETMRLRADSPAEIRASDDDNALDQHPTPRGESPSIFEVKKKTWSPSDKHCPIKILPNGQCSVSSSANQKRI
jgi:hypothetical protein